MAFWTRICHYIILMLLAYPDSTWETSITREDNKLYKFTFAKESPNLQNKIVSSSKSLRNKYIPSIIGRQTIVVEKKVHIARSNEQIKNILESAKDKFVMINFCNTMNNKEEFGNGEDYSYKYLSKLAKENPHIVVVIADPQKCPYYVDKYDVDILALPETVFLRSNLIKGWVNGVKPVELETKIKKFLLNL